MPPSGRHGLLALILRGHHVAPDTEQEASTIVEAALGQLPRMCPPAIGAPERPGRYPDADAWLAVRRELLDLVHRASAARPAGRRAGGGVRRGGVLVAVPGDGALGRRRGRVRRGPQ